MPKFHKIKFFLFITFTLSVCFVITNTIFIKPSKLATLDNKLNFSSINSSSNSQYKKLQYYWLLKELRAFHQNKNKPFYPFALEKGTTPQNLIYYHQIQEYIKQLDLIKFAYYLKYKKYIYKKQISHNIALIKRIKHLINIKATHKANQIIKSLLIQQHIHNHYSKDSQSDYKYIEKNIDNKIIINNKKYKSYNTPQHYKHSRPNAPKIKVNNKTYTKNLKSNLYTVHKKKSSKYIRNKNISRHKIYKPRLVKKNISEAQIETLTNQNLPKSKNITSSNIHENLTVESNNQTSNQTVNQIVKTKLKTQTTTDQTQNQIRENTPLINNSKKVAIRGNIYRRKKGNVKIITYPYNCQVTINGHFKGVTQKNILVKNEHTGLLHTSLNKGVYNIKITKEGFQPYISSFTKKSNGAKTIQIELKKVIFTNSFGINFCGIPSGNFIIGSSEDEKGRNNDEQRVEVTLSKPLWISCKEITQKQWQKIMKSTIFEQINKAKVVNPSEINDIGADNPIFYVNWFEAINFCKILNDKETASGKLPKNMYYRLPTEAEWEIACRSGENLPFNLKNSNSFSYGLLKLLPPQANYKPSNPQNFPFGRNTIKTANFKPNRWGFYDFHGNVAEWTYDKYSFYLKNGTDPISNYQLVVDKNINMVVRGGSWQNNQNNCRASARAKHTADTRARNIGFRIALVYK